MSKDPRLLIDADGFLFRSVAAAEYEGDLGNGVIVASTNLNKAIDMFKSQMEALERELGHGEKVMVISGDQNFRKTLSPLYKAHRVSRKPLGYLKLTEWLKETYGDRVVSQPCLEADDYLGILATRPGAPEQIVVSDDKDLQTIPCQLFRLGGLSTIGVEDADRFWLYQTLTGDPADGYKGCPGVGPVKAQKILSKNGGGWEAVKREFLKSGLSVEDAVLQARLARILRFNDWDSQNKRPILWTPPA